MAKIAAYTPRVTPLYGYDEPQGVDIIYSMKIALLEEPAKYGGYSPATGLITPFRSIAQEEKMGTVSAQQYLDNITAAVEAGHADAETFFADFFETAADWEALAGRLEGYDIYWTNDRHFHAMIKVLVSDDMECSTYPEIANAIRQAAEN